MENAEGQALFVVCSVVTDEAAPKADGEDVVVVKTDDECLDEAEWEDKLAFAVEKMTDWDAADQISVVLVLLVDQQGQLLDSHLVSCDHSFPVVLKTYP